jgi:YtcA family
MAAFRRSCEKSRFRQAIDAVPVQALMLRNGANVFPRRSQPSREIAARHRVGMKVAALSWCKALPYLAERQRWIMRRRIGVGFVALPLLSLCGCSAAGAPSFDIFGAFFPAWLLCAALGIFVALGARIFFAARNLTDVLPFQLPVCTSIGAICALLIWLICFGR